MTVRMAFTRPEDKIRESVELAESLGLSVSAAPSLRIMPGTDEQFLSAEGMLSSGSVDYAVFGSGTAVESCASRWGARMPSLFSGCRTVSIGPHTSDVMARNGIGPDMMPEDDYSSYGIVSMMSPLVKGRSVMLVRSDSGSDVLRDGLADAGADVVDFQSYRLEMAGETPELASIMDSIASGNLDVMAFTSPMSASIFVGQMRSRYGDRADAMLDSVVLAAIGGPTSMRLSELGHPPGIVPERTTFRDMLEAIARSGKD